MSAACAASSISGKGSYALVSPSSAAMVLKRRGSHAVRARWLPARKCGQTPDRTGSSGTQKLTVIAPDMQ